MGLSHDTSVSAHYVNSALLLLGACIPSAVVIVSTPKSGANSLPRYIWALVIASNARRLFQELAGITTSFVLNCLVMGQLIVVLLQCCNLLAITRLDAHDLIRGDIFQFSDAFFHKVFRTTCLIFNLRGVGTPWQVKRLHRFPRFFDRCGDDGKPNRCLFVLRQGLIVAWQYLILDIIYQSSLDTPPEETERLFGQGKEFLYLDATVEQWAARVAVSLVSCLAPARVTTDIAYRSLSLLSVSVGFTSADEWPPLFGSISDAYTIRRCWSIFWHQHCQWALTSVSNCVCRDILHLPRPSILDRYSNITIAFVVSGAIHVMIDSFCWKPESKAPTVAFFGSFAVAILLEDRVQALCRRLTGVDTRNGKQDVPVWHKIVGYVWVTSWLSLTVPWYLYHPTRLSPKVKWLVPYSVVALVGSPAAHGLLIMGGLVLKFVIGGEL
ncbi:hypothetical protein FZEAL_5154 [Fusarium zealandicum]|uniref:Wax synthase domain-containing protein n=1 Tax=Fusarium zealandicum TaxID=1053134 RepID=A0A8H4UKR2_9HYPO|nr:hypothetical protein FZEAL_5154 [Fusarium zealandicum]